MQPLALSPLDELVFHAEFDTVEELRASFERLRVSNQLPDINAIGQQGYPPLVACLQDTAHGFDGIHAKVDYLLSMGANVDAPGRGGNTALHYAAQDGERKSFERLMQAGASVYCLDDRNRSALHFACRRGHAWAVEALLALGAPIEGRDSRHRTPLFCAAEYDQCEVIAMMIAAGADEGVSDIEGVSCRQVANRMARAALDAAVLGRKTAPTKNRGGSLRL